MNKRYLHRTIYDFLKENADVEKIMLDKIDEVSENKPELAKRIKNAINWINDTNIKIGEKAFFEYIDFNEKNLDKIEKFIHKIESLWFADLPMILELDKIVEDIEIIRTDVIIKYEYTHVSIYEEKPYGHITDRYNITYYDSLNERYTEEITSEDILNLIENGAFMSENGIFGLKRKDVLNCLNEYFG